MVESLVHAQMAVKLAVEAIAAAHREAQGTSPLAALLLRELDGQIRVIDTRLDELCAGLGGAP